MKQEALPFLEVMIEDAKFLFEPVTHQHWLELLDIAGKDLTVKFDQMLKKLVSIENYFDHLGNAILTSEALKNAKYTTFKLLLDLYKAWQEKIAEALGVNTGAEEKKAPSSSDTSASPSTSQPSSAGTAQS